jgi:serine/threonine protein kinase
MGELLPFAQLEEECLFIPADHVCSYCYRKGIFHLDVNPNNILKMTKEMSRAKNCFRMRSMKICNRHMKPMVIHV